MSDESSETDPVFDSVQEKADKYGVKGPGGDDEQEAGSDTSSSGGAEQVVQQEPRSAGGPDVHEYPNPDRELGALAEVYENNNVFLSPAVVDAVEELWDDIEYEWKKSHDTELNKNWDFYMACFRVLLDNPDLVRDELEMDA